ncbi:MAG: 16S rRNA (uracil(1498)-N(3))-methyltransferase [Porphyromonadaceae bacterium]|nr:16S rRNA (uracil(1498)-N(3))-methyltransferase [Porphyromonadaceae bacterium]
MEKHIFYTPDIAVTKELPEEESHHCVKVLRLAEGDELLLTDGAGFFYRASITSAHPKHCVVEILETIPAAPSWPFNVHIAIAPTKNMDRMEWFVEKCTEIGVNAITLLRCRFSERKELKTDRLRKIMISAMKQSQKAVCPQLREMTDFIAFVKTPFAGEKYIAHCQAGDRRLLSEIYPAGHDAVVLIGPEGDFSPEEVQSALSEGFSPISLGESRLRTETAGVVACHTLHVLNEMKNKE